MTSNKMMMKRKRKRRPRNSNEWSATKEATSSAWRVGHQFTDKTRKTIITLSRMWAASLSSRSTELSPMKRYHHTWRTIYRDYRILRKKVRSLIGIRNWISHRSHCWYETLDMEETFMWIVVMRSYRAKTLKREIRRGIRMCKPKWRRYRLMNHIWR